LAIGFYFSPSAFTPARYDEVIKRLDAAGAGAPAGRTYHFALEVNGLIQVFDVWESQESFEAFGGGDADSDHDRARSRSKHANSRAYAQHHHGLRCESSPIDLA
jgi:hypothetical protein